MTSSVRFDEHAETREWTDRSVSPCTVIIVTALVIDNTKAEKDFKARFAAPQ
jgi:hypothetical protein